MLNNIMSQIYTDLKYSEAFIVFGNLSEAQEQFDIMFKKTRRKLVKEISESLTMIEKVLDACFGELATLLSIHR